MGDRLSFGWAHQPERHACYQPRRSIRFHLRFLRPDPGCTSLTSFWSSYCIDTASQRYCIDEDENECPSKTGPLTFPNIIVDHTDSSGPYSVEDYAFDMADRAR